MNERRPMDKKEATRILAKAIGGLDQEGLENLRWHLLRGTTILCGKDAEITWIDGKGGG